VRVAGVVPETALQDMQAVTLAPNHVNTVLYGLADEAALYGLLARLRALGLEIVEVRRVPEPRGASLDADTTETREEPRRA